MINNTKRGLNKILILFLFPFKSVYLWAPGSGQNVNILRPSRSRLAFHATKERNREKYIIFQVFLVSSSSHKYLEPRPDWSPSGGFLIWNSRLFHMGVQRSFECRLKLLADIPIFMMTITHTYLLSCFIAFAYVALIQSFINLVTFDTSSNWLHDFHVVYVTVKPTCKNVLAF